MFFMNLALTPLFSEEYGLSKHSNLCISKYDVWPWNLFVSMDMRVHNVCLVLPSTSTTQRQRLKEGYLCVFYSVGSWIPGFVFRVWLSHTLPVWKCTASNEMLRIRYGRLKIECSVLWLYLGEYLCCHTCSCASVLPQTESWCSIAGYKQGCPQVSLLSSGGLGLFLRGLSLSVSFSLCLSLSLSVSLSVSVFLFVSLSLCLSLSMSLSLCDREKRLHAKHSHPALCPACLTRPPH